MTKLSVAENSHKKAPIDSLKKLHRRCSESIQRAKELLEKTKEQQLLVKDELQNRETQDQRILSTPMRWLCRGVTPSPQSSSLETLENVRSSEYSPPSYLHQVIRKLSRSPPPRVSCNELHTTSVSESRRTSHKSVSFVEDSNFESATPTSKGQL